MTFDWKAQAQDLNKKRAQNDYNNNAWQHINKRRWVTS